MCPGGSLFYPKPYNIEGETFTTAGGGNKAGGGAVLEGAEEDLEQCLERVGLRTAARGRVGAQRGLLERGRHLVLSAAAPRALLLLPRLARLVLPLICSSHSRPVRSA